MSDDLLKDPTVRAHVRTLLSEDPLAEAERITGKRHDDPLYGDATACLGLSIAMESNRRKSAMLATLDDTDYGMRFEDTRRIAHELGFSEVSIESFIDPENGLENLYIVGWREDGYLLTMESFCWERGNDLTTNSAKIYFNLANGRSVYMACRCSGGMSREHQDVFVGDQDVREGFRVALAEFEGVGAKPLNPWVERPFLWLSNFVESKQRDYKTVLVERIAKLPENVRQAISP